MDSLMHRLDSAVDRYALAFGGGFMFAWILWAVVT
jgi:hypothetical protein